MKVLYTKTVGRVTLTAKVAPDHLKLFIDAEVVPPTIPAPSSNAPDAAAPQPASVPTTPHAAPPSPKPAPPGAAPAAAPKYIPDPAVTREELFPLFEPVFNSKDMDQKVLDDVAKTLSKGEKVFDRRVRKGDPAEAGHDGKLLLLVRKFTGTGEIFTDEEKYASFMERHLFDNIVAGQIVGRVYPPKPGKEGKDIFGAAIPAPPSQPAKFSIDNTLKLEKHPPEEYEVLISQLEGLLLENSGALTVKDELTLSGDLGLRLGNIDCIGRVKVSGNVASGITLRAKKGIEVGGGIQESILECPGGDVVVKGFAFGGARGKIVGGKEVKLGIAQELRVEAIKDIFIEKEAIDCVFRTQSLLRIPAGKLIGGEAFVVCGLEAKQLGNDVSKETIIHLCSDIETSTEYAVLMASIAAHDNAQRLVEVHLGPYARMPDRIQLLKQPFRGRMEKLYEKREEILVSRGKLTIKQETLLAEAHRSGILRVSVHGQIFPGVSIIAGEKRLDVQELITGPKTIEFDPKEQTFAIKAFEPVVCAFNAVDSGKKHDKSK